MYIEKKYLVINEDTSIYICGGSLRYMDNKGERFEIIENIDKNDVRQMIKRALASASFLANNLAAFSGF